MTVAIFFLLFCADMFCWYEIWSQVRLGGYYYSCKNAALVALFISAPILMLNNRIVSMYPQILLAIILPVIVVECYCRINFQMFLSGTIVAIVLESNIQEIKEFCRGILSGQFIFGLCVTISAFAIFSRYVWKNAKKIRKSRILFIVGILSAMPVLLSMLLAKYTNQSVFSLATPIGRTALVNVLRSCIYDIEKMGEMVQRARNPIFPEDIYTEWRDSNTIGIIFVGESASRNYWGLYGYNRNTTPEMMKREGEIVKYTDTICAWSNTAPALKYLLTQCTLETPDTWNCTLNQLYQHCGWRTAMISSTSHWGEWDTVGNLVWDDADYSFYLQDHNKGGASYDGELLEYIKKYIDGYAGQSRLIFIHIQGSHSPYTYYPDTWECPFGKPTKDQDKQNLYDNSIAYTDALLGGILSILESKNNPSFFVYISDHGETPKAPGHLFRQVRDADCWEIPFVLWFSPAYKQSHPEFVKRVKDNSSIAIQSDQLYWGLAELGGIVSKSIGQRNNIFSKTFTPRKERALSTANTNYSTIRP